MRKSDLRQLAIEQQDLPTLPAIAIKVLRAVREDGSDFDTLTRIVTNDQSLAARILSYANTAPYRHHGPITDLNRAIKILGTRTIRNLVVSVSIFRLFKPSDAIEGFDLSDFWRHSIGCGLAARAVAKLLHHPDPEEAFAAGLLHDIGKIFFAERIPADLAEVLEEHAASGAPLMDVEEDIIGISHTQAGKWLADNWQLPRALTNAIWLHHQPLPGNDYEIAQSLPAIVRLADTLCLLYRLGASGNRRMVSPSELTSACKALDDDTVSGIVSEVIRQLDEVYEFLGLENRDEDLFIHAIQMSNQELNRLNLELESRQDDLTREQKVLRAICAMTNRIETTMPLGQVVEEIAAAAREAFDADRAICFAINPEEEHIEGRVIGAKGRMSEPMLLPLTGATEAPSALRQEEIDILESSFLAMPQGPELWNQVAGTIQRGALMALPLTSGHQILGQLMIDFGRQPSERAATRDILDLFASSASQCIQRCRLQAEVAESAEELARTARKSEEKQVQLYRVQRLASVGKLAAGCAHEINNPLAVISGTAQMLLRQANDEKITRQLETVIAQAKRITKIINDLMGLARPAEPRIEYTDVTQVIDETIGLLEERRGFDKIEFIRDYAENLPKTLADPKQLEQVFINLFINARDAMPKGGELRITVQTERDQRSLSIAVADTGEGIPGDRIDHIFDPFYTTKREGEGTGLGLAICHSIIESHRGSMQVTSTPGKGTTFRITVPVRQRTTISDFRKELVKNKKKPDLKVVEKETRILLVDDEEGIRTILAEALREEGYNVTEASDGVQGMRFLHESRFDAALLDIRMPHKDGMEMLGEIRKDYPDMPVIVVTGLASDREVQEAVKSGVYSVVKKPFDIDEVLYTLKKAVKKDVKKKGNDAT